MSNKFHQGAKIINFLVVFAGMALKLEKAGLTLSSFHPCPPLPSLAKDDMEQFQCLNMVLFLEFSWCEKSFSIFQGSKGVAVVRALASHQWGLGSNPGFEAICGLSLLLVLSLAPRGFSPGTPDFPSAQRPTFPNSDSIWDTPTSLNEFLRTPKCFVGERKIKKVANSMK